LLEIGCCPLSYSFDLLQALAHRRHESRLLSGFVIQPARKLRTPGRIVLRQFEY
jgi:hypothetical protein